MMSAIAIIAVLVALTVYTVSIAVLVWWGREQHNETQPHAHSDMESERRFPSSDTLGQASTWGDYGRGRQ